MQPADVGRFFVVGFEGTEVSEALAQLAQQYPLGGVILFKRNIETPEQLTRLNANIAGLARHDQFIISVDQEGGPVQRLKPPHFPDFPAAQDIPPHKVEQTGYQIGSLLAELGFNLDFAPVLDVDSNPQNPIIGKRAFGLNAEQAVKGALDFMRGLHRAGIWSCGKHFPGHGDTELDSHLAVPVVERPLAQLEQVELPPFAQAIAAGIPTLMSAHVVYPALDDQCIATFSAKIMTDLLRNRMGFKGVLFSDSLEMKGAAENRTPVEVAIEAFAAGCDQLLVCEQFDQQQEIIDGLAQAINDSTALKKRAEHSLQRISRTFASVSNG